MSVTQEQVENKAAEIKNKVDLTQNVDFIKNNYEILLKKRVNTRLELIIINDCLQNTWKYKSPEHVDLSLETICFYLALDKLGVEPEKW